jgi:hypothetical protein
MKKWKNVEWEWLKEKMEEAIQMIKEKQVAAKKDRESEAPQSKKKESISIHHGRNQESMNLNQDRQ